MAYIYADNAATTRLSDAAFEAMKPYMLAEYGNASTLYKLGRSAHKACLLYTSDAADEL